MIYRYNITTPANTPETAKQRTILPLARGVIHQIEIIFHPGPAKVLHLQLNRGLHQIWPSNSEEAFASDNDKLSYREHFEINYRPFQLEAKTWNTSTTNPHDVIVRIGVLERRFILRRLF